LIKSPQKPNGKNVRSMIGYAVKTPWENKEKMIQHIMIIASINSMK
jgi:hypothetical protein